ncbi:uncharacterized protein LOC133907505 [Phragmites australis]|uniref:uncharacterized protein LOC133907505 n=1 Tax=Phragmites australis TaxID=29695 RepID=UPI002D77A293|nr:uncharacterized protein LOC133907505 [Phragmites australis]
MATAWVRSLSCRSSYAVIDAAVAPSPAKKPPSPPFPVSCAAAAAADVMDAVAFAQHAKKKKMGRERERRREARERHEPRPRPKKKPKPMASATTALFMPSPAPAPVSSAFLTMAELPEGHSSRRVVELIFSSGWGGAAGAPEPAVEALFRVHSAARAVARFEEARATARAHGAAARCGADGNEMMRFQCSASADAGGVFGAGVATCRIGPSVSAVRTFACSGAAHASAGGCVTTGRRAMLVCRVIAGRVRPANDPSLRRAHTTAVDYDSVDMGNGELVVMDSRAVLPCFLIIYKV